MSTVWHLNRDKRIDAWAGNFDSIRFPDDYTIVAEVDSEDLNHITKSVMNSGDSWHLNHGVKVLSRKAWRTTTLGDVIVIGDMRYRCGVKEWKMI